MALIPPRVLVLPTLPKPVLQPAPLVKVAVPSRTAPLYSAPSPASPIHLSSSLVLQPGSNGAPPPAALKNPMGQDMELLEIKFELSAANVNTSTPVLGGTINCELTLGSIKLTNGSVPCWCFGRVETSPNGESKTDTTDNRYWSSFSWRLPRPLFIPAGAVLTPNFTHTGFIKSPINVRVGYSARSVFVKPKKIYVPYVASFTSKVFNPISDADTDSSTELDLVNPNSEVLYLQRFTGRTQMSVGTSQVQVESYQPVGSQFLNLRMTDSYGRPLVQYFTPFRTVFSSPTRSWEMDNGSQLDPDAYYILDLRKDAMVVQAGQEIDTAQAFVGMVGWREMEKL